MCAYVYVSVGMCVRVRERVCMGACMHACVRACMRKQDVHRIFRGFVATRPFSDPRHTDVRVRAFVPVCECAYVSSVELG